MHKNLQIIFLISIINACSPSDKVDLQCGIYKNNNNCFSFIRNNNCIFINWVVDSIQLNSNDTQFLPEYRSPCLKRIPIKYERKSKNSFELNSNSKCEDKKIIELGTYEYIPVDPEYTHITIKFIGEKEDTIKRSSLNSTYKNTLFSMDTEIELMLAGVLDEMLTYREGTNPLVTISFWNDKTLVKQIQTNQFPFYMSNFGKYIFSHPRYPKE